MPALTTNFSFNKPLVNNATDQDLWGGYLNDNFDSLDTTLKVARELIHRNISGADTATTADRNKIILCDATAAAFAPVLPSAVTAGDGFKIIYKKTDASAHAVTVTRAAAETIDGSTTYALSGQNEVVALVSDGSNWQVWAYKTTPSAVPSASTSAQGIIEIAIDAEFQTGTDTARAITAANVKNSLLFSKSYESPQQAISIGSNITLTHSLGAIPKLAIGELVCITTDLGYAVGDRVPFSAVTNGAGSGNLGLQLAYNTTQIIVVVASSAIDLINKSTGVATGSIDVSKWKAVARAWA